MKQRVLLMVTAIAVAITIAAAISIGLQVQSGGAFAFIGEEYQTDFPYDGKPNPEAKNRMVPQFRKTQGNTYYGNGIPLRDEPAGPMDLPALPIVHNMNVEIVPETNGLPFSTDRGAIAARSADITKFFFKR